MPVRARACVYSLLGLTKKSLTKPCHRLIYLPTFTSAGNFVGSLPPMTFASRRGLNRACDNAFPVRLRLWFSNKDRYRQPSHRCVYRSPG